MKAVKQTFKFGRLKVVIDSSQVFPNDPGQGTPVMVYAKDVDRSEMSATIGCALGEGEVESVKLNDDEMTWLSNIENKSDRLLATFWRQS